MFGHVGEGRVQKAWPDFPTHWRGCSIGTIVSGQFSKWENYVFIYSSTTFLNPQDFFLCLLHRVAAKTQYIIFRNVPKKETDCPRRTFLCVFGSVDTVKVYQ